MRKKVLRYTFWQRDYLKNKWDHRQLFIFDIVSFSFVSNDFSFPRSSSMAIIMRIGKRKAGININRAGNSTPILMQFEPRSASPQGILERVWVGSVALARNPKVNGRLFVARSVISMYPGLGVGVGRWWHLFRCWVPCHLCTWWWCLRQWLTNEVQLFSLCELKSLCSLYWDFLPWSSWFQSRYHVATVFLSPKRRCLICTNICLAREDEASNWWASRCSVDSALCCCWVVGVTDGSLLSGWEEWSMDRRLSWPEETSVVESQVLMVSLSLNRMVVMGVALLSLLELTKCWVRSEWIRQWKCWVRSDRGNGGSIKCSWYIWYYEYCL